MFNPINWLLSFFSLDIGIDLGTANTLVYIRGKGIVVNEPSWVAVDKRSHQPLAVGTQAKRMAGRAPANVQVVRPVRDGVISDFEITEAMLEHLIAKAHEQSIVPAPHPRVVIGIPAGVTEVEMRAVYDAAMAAGARETHLIEEPIAAAIGAGLSIGEIEGHMIVDIGGGTTEVAVLSMGHTVVARSLRVAGDEMDEAIVQYLRNKYNLLIGERAAEELKMTIGSAHPLKKEMTAVARGRNLVTGLPEAIEVSSIEIREAIAGPVQAILDTIRDTIDEAPAEIIADLMENGITLAGGGAQLLGLDERIQEELGLRTWVAEDPQGCVARGAGLVLEDLKAYQGFLVDMESLA